MSAQDFFQLFFYASNWNLQLNVLFLIGAVLYLLLTGPWREKFQNAKPVPAGRRITFLIGWLLYYFSLGSPLSLLSHELFSMHMLQMSIEYFMVPPMLLVGLPEHLLKPFLRFTRLDQVLKFFTKPLFSVFFFNGLISFYHVPVIFGAVMESHALHIVSHTLLMFAAFCVWWSIIGPIAEMDRLKPLHKLGLIVANGILLTPACAIITFTDQVLFEQFAEMSTLAPIMTPIHDQQLGGVIMKIVQEIVYIVAIAFVFVRWVREERAKDHQELMKISKQENPMS